MIQILPNTEAVASCHSCGKATHIERRAVPSGAGRDRTGEPTYHATGLKLFDLRIGTSDLIPSSTVATLCLTCVAYLSGFAHTIYTKEPV